VFNKMTALERDQHRDLRFVKAQGYGFASSLMVSPVMVGEAALVARDMPLLFSNANHMPVALLGLKQDHNAYVESNTRVNGKWLGRYVPAHIRRYPFMLAQHPANPKEDSDEQAFTVMVDLAAPHFASPQGERLFDEQGQPTEVLTGIQQVLMDLQRAHVRTERCVQQLVQAELLVERVLQAQTAAGKPFALQGMMIIDTQRLNQLAPEQLTTLQHSGALALVYAHMMSLSNLNEKPLRVAENLAPLPSAFGGDTIAFGALKQA
jgi:hypothetical protein